MIVVPNFGKPYIVLILVVLLSACDGPRPAHVQGYAEGEFVYVASPLPGQLLKLAVNRGQQVKRGGVLFELESVSERASRDEADRRLLQARSTLEDLTKGKRPTELQALEAQIKSAQAALTQSQREFSRQEKLRATNASSEQDYDRARSNLDQNSARARELEAELATARLGARPDQIRAAEAEVHALEAALARAEWDLSQKSQFATKAGLVFDTLYREGEWVDKGHPVVTLLPPENMKVRAFVPEHLIGRIRIGNSARVSFDGNQDGLDGRVSYVSPKAEFTPPVIYSRGSREKLVFLVELRFEPEIAVKLHPGQPVDVDFVLSER